MLLRAHDYFQYTYELELGRTGALNETTKRYFLFQASTFTAVLAVLKWYTPDPTGGDAWNSPGPHIGLWFLAVAFILLLMSFLFTIMVMHIRRFERLSDPSVFVREIAAASNEADVLESIIANYVVATGRNFTINQAKAKWLARAFASYLGGAVCLLLGGALLILVT